MTRYRGVGANNDGTCDANCAPLCLSGPIFGQGQPTSARGRPLLSRIPRHADCQRRTPPPSPFPSVPFFLAVLLPSCAGAHLAPSWARGALQVSVAGVRVASAVASSDHTFGRRSHPKTKFDRQHVLVFCPSLSQQWACIVITGTNARGSSAYVHHGDHTDTEVCQSDVLQRSSHTPHEPAAKNRPQSWLASALKCRTKCNDEIVSYERHGTTDDRRSQKAGAHHCARLSVPALMCTRTRGYFLSKSVRRGRTSVCAN